MPKSGLKFILAFLVGVKMDFEGRSLDGFGEKKFDFPMYDAHNYFLL
jgi:hypothetical protein